MEPVEDVVPHDELAAARRIGEAERVSQKEHGVEGHHGHEMAIALAPRHDRADGSGSADAGKDHERVRRVVAVVSHRRRRTKRLWVHEGVSVDHSLHSQNGQYQTTRTITGVFGARGRGNACILPFRAPKSCEHD
jgi:hypothetical protein